MRPGAILFDLDETLIDRPASLDAYVRRFTADFGDRLLERDPGRIRAVLVAADGNGYRARERPHDIVSGLPWSDEPSPGVVDAHFRDVFPGAVIAMDGARETLRRLRRDRLRLGLITNGNLAEQGRKLDVLGLRELLDEVVISEATGTAKPDPAIFLRATAALGVAPAEAWFVGDHPANDVDGARNAGLTGVWLRRPVAAPGAATSEARVLASWPDSLEPPDHVLETLVGLVDLVEAALA